VSVYESPAKRRLREAVEEAHDDADFAARLVDAINNDETVRAAIVRLSRRATAAPAPAAKKAVGTRGRGR
jgi:hypothetical protein